MSDSELTELRYKETAEAIRVWVRGQKGKASSAEVRGIVQAFLEHSAAAVVSTIPGCDESDAQLLVVYFFEAMKRFCEEKMEELEN